MSESCDIESCQSTLGITCDCCNKIYCPDHLDEHYQLINNQLNPLFNEINNLSDQIINKSKEKLIGNSLEKLNKWRNESYKLIDNIYEKKRNELEDLYKKKSETQRKEIDNIQLKINKLIHEENTREKDIEELKSIIKYIKYQIKDLHQIFYQINIRPLEFYENYISIEEIKTNEIDFTILLPSYKTIECFDEYQTICSSNNEYLLIFNNNQLQLFDKNLTIIKKLSWKNCGIYDICWSSTLQKFILLTYNQGICLIDKNLTDTEFIQIDKNKIWYRCTSSDISLYLISSRHQMEIFQYDLLSSFQLINRWKIPYSSKEHDTILDIIYNNQTIALIIRNHNKISMELRSTITFDRIWSIQLDTKCGIFYSNIRFCLLNSNDWLIIDYKDSNLIHINQNGIIKSITQYNSSPITALLFASNILVIKTNQNWNFHEI